MGEFFHFLGLFTLTFFIRISAFEDVTRMVIPLWLVELCLGSLGMAPENGSTGHHSYFTLAEGEDAKMETAEVS